MRGPFAVDTRALPHHRHIAAPQPTIFNSQTLDPVPAGRMEAFVGASAMYAVGTAIIGASPAAYAADVMPAGAAGLGLGIYRCFGDLGEHESVVGSGLASNSCLLDSFGAAASRPARRSFTNKSQNCVCKLRSDVGIGAAGTLHQ